MVRTPKCFSQFFIIEFSLLGMVPNWLHPILRRSAHVLAVFQVLLWREASVPYILFPTAHHVIPKS